MPQPPRPDVVDVLVAEHDELRTRCAALADADPSDRVRLLRSLVRLVHRHETGNRVVVHPMTRARAAGGNAVALDGAADDRALVLAVIDLQRTRATDASFAARLANFQQLVRAHCEREERDEHPLLRRWVPTQRLHAMANQVHNIQTMG